MPRVKKIAGLSFDQMVVGLLFVSVGLLACMMPAQADTFWHLRAGSDLWKTGHIPRTDIYSYTAAGLPWPDHEWLWQAFAFALYRIGGMPLLTGTHALLVVTSLSIAYRAMVGTTSTRLILMLPVIPLIAPEWSLRPQIVTLLLIAAVVQLLIDERFFWLPPLFVFWANVHGGVALGGVVLVSAWLAAAWRARRKDPGDRRRMWVLGSVVVLCALATTATPLGFGIFRFVVDSEVRLHRAQISEWLPTLPGLSSQGVFWVFAIAFLSLVVARWRSVREGSWADWVAVAAVLGLLPLAFRSIRNVGPCLLIMPPAASRLLGAGVSFWRRPASASRDHPRFNAAVVAGFATAAALFVWRMWTAPLSRLGWQPIASEVLQLVRDCPERVYNHYDDGGFLIWFAPEKRVFIDSRQDPYPIAFLLRSIRVEQGKEPSSPLFAEYGIHCAFLSAKSPMVATLAADAWSTRYRDDRWAVLTRP